MLVEDAQGLAWKVVPLLVVAPPAWCKVGRSSWVHLYPGGVQKQPSCWQSFPECNTLLTPLASNQVGNFTDGLWQGKLLMSKLKHSPGGRASGGLLRGYILEQNVKQGGI